MTLYISVTWIWSNSNFVKIFFMDYCGQLTDIRVSGIYKKKKFPALSELEPGPGWLESGMRIRRYDKSSIHTPYRSWSKGITILTSQLESALTSSGCMKIRTRSQASTNDNFEVWKALVSPKSVPIIALAWGWCTAYWLLGLSQNPH